MIGEVLKKRSFIAYLAAILIVVSVCGCSTVKFVADYDSATLEKILDTGKEVDLFYGKLLATPENKRQFSNYQDQYVVIEVDIRDIVSRNIARPLNSESTRISQIILKQWDECRDKHKSKDTYKDGVAQLDRDNFTDLFRAASNSEIAKNIK